MTIIEKVIEELTKNDIGVVNNEKWFSNEDDLLDIIPINYYELDEYGYPTEKAIKRIEKEITDLIGNGAMTIEEAIDMWISEQLIEGRLVYIDQIRTNYKQKPIIDGTTAHKAIPVGDKTKLCLHDNIVLTEAADIQDYDEAIEILGQLSVKNLSTLVTDLMKNFSQADITNHIANQLRQAGGASLSPAEKGTYIMQVLSTMFPVANIRTSINNIVDNNDINKNSQIIALQGLNGSTEQERDDAVREEAAMQVAKQVATKLVNDLARDAGVDRNTLEFVINKEGNEYAGVDVHIKNMDDIDDLLDNDECMNFIADRYNEHSNRKIRAEEITDENIQDILQEILDVEIDDEVYNQGI